MSINRLPDRRDYWKITPLLHYTPNAGRISRDRFESIMRYLHFVDNTTLPVRREQGYHRLGKVRPVVDHIVAKCEELYHLHCEVAIDEAMIKFHGRSAISLTPFSIH